jgi:hypothetical protein
MIGTSRHIYIDAVDTDAWDAYRARQLLGPVRLGIWHYVALDWRRAQKRKSRRGPVASRKSIPEIKDRVHDVNDQAETRRQTPPERNA